MADTANGQAQAITVLQRPGGLGCAALSLKDKNARETSKWLEKVAGSNYLLNGTDGEKKKLADKASQNDGINADSPDNLNLLVLYGTVMKRTGFPVLIDVSSKSCVKNLKATIVDFANSTDAKVKLSSSEKKALRDGIASLESKGILTRGLQDLVIKRGMADQQRIDSVKKTTSNDLINRPDAAIKVELKNRKFDVQGIRVVDNKIVVDDASFRGVDIEHVIRCFKDKNYHIFFELPSFNDRIVRKLIEINDGYSAYGLNELEHGVLIKLADDINQGGKSIDNNGDDLSGLDDVDMGVLASIITKLEARASSDDDKETVVMLNLAKKGLKKYSRGLSRDEIYFLSSLLDLMKSGQKSVPTRIKMGETNLDEYPAQYRSTIRSGLKVLERIGQELAAVAVQAEKKVDKKANTFDEIKELYTESFKRTVEYADMRQAVATSAPPGYIILLKAEFFRNTYLKEMKELSKLFYGETDSSGNKITTGIFDNVKGDVKSMISRLNAMGAHQEAIAKQINEGRYSSTSEFNDLYASYCNLYNARVKLSDEITAVSNMDPETQIKYERYKQVVRYMMSEEIDYEFISKLQTVNPQAFDKAVDLTDPYTEEMVKMSPKQLIMGDGGKDSIISKFRNGETWISSNIVVGEGKKSDKYVLAKQALASMLAKMALTQNTVNFTGPLAFFAGAGILTRLKINPTAAFIVAKSLGPVSADLMPKIGIKTGVQTYADLKATDVDWMRKATGGIVDNFAMQTGTRANQNLGKAWMDHIGQRSDNPGGMLVKSVGHDAMLCKNRMDAEYVGKIIKYVDDLNDRAHGNVMNPETGKKEYKYEVEAKVASKLEELKKNDMPLAVIDLSSKKSISKIKDGLEDLKEAMGRLGKGKQYIDLQEDFASDAVNLKGADEKTRKTIEEGAELLRKLLPDVQTLEFIISAAQEKDKADDSSVVQANLGDKMGNRMDVVMLDEAGEIKTDRIERSFIEHVEKFCEETPQKFFEFNVMMRFWNIPLGFYNAAAFTAAWAVAKAKYAVSGSKADYDRMQFAGKMAIKLWIETYASFQGFEYFPQTPLLAGYEKLKKGDYGGALSEFVICIPMAYSAAKRDIMLARAGYGWLTKNNSYLEKEVTKHNKMLETQKVDIMKKHMFQLERKFSHLSDDAKTAKVREEMTKVLQTLDKNKNLKPITQGEYLIRHQGLTLKVFMDPIRKIALFVEQLSKSQKAGVALAATLTIKFFKGLAWLTRNTLGLLLQGIVKVGKIPLAVLITVFRPFIYLAGLVRKLGSGVYEKLPSFMKPALNSAGGLLKFIFVKLPAGDVLGSARTIVVKSASYLSGFKYVTKPVSAVAGTLGTGLITGQMADFAMEMFGVSRDSSARKWFVGGAYTAPVAYSAGTFALVKTGLLKTAPAAGGTIFRAGGLYAAFSAPFLALGGLGWAAQKTMLTSYTRSVAERATENYVNQVGIGGYKHVMDFLGLGSYLEIWYSSYAKAWYDQVEAADKAKVREFAGGVTYSLAARLPAGIAVPGNSIDLNDVKNSIKGTLKEICGQNGKEKFAAMQEFIKVFKTGNAVDMPQELLDLDVNNLDSFEPSDRLVKWVIMKVVNSRGDISVLLK